MKTLVVVQARTGSTRLPGKVLMPLAGAPLLERLLQRVQAAATPFALVVATTTDPVDAPIEDLCLRKGVLCFKGHPTDLLDRHYQAARALGADVVCKIPSDCPLIDPGVVDSVLGAFLRDAQRHDFVSNLHPQSYPDGNDVEVLSMASLETAWREARRPFEREHTTPFVWDRPERFRLGNVRWEDGRDLSMTHRFTVDYPEDYAFVAAVYDALFEEGREPFGLLRILSFLDDHPEVRALNAGYAGVNWYRNHLSELRTVSAADTRSPRAAP